MHFNLKKKNDIALNLRWKHVLKIFRTFYEADFYTFRIYVCTYIQHPVTHDKHYNFIIITHYFIFTAAIISKLNIFISIIVALL